MTKLLIIDDEPAIARLIKRAAEDRGYETVVVTEAGGFMDCAVEHDPAVICLDLSMPGTDGIELLRFLATIKCSAKILIISGFDPRVLETAARLGEALGLHMAGTLVKPLRMADLRSSIPAIAQEGRA